VNLMIWLIRMKRWAANPPSARMVALVFGVIAACLVLAGVELIWGFPEWLVPQRIRP
jgi:hypothetical protein